MSPRSQFLLSVTVAAAAIGAAWLLLFARNALTPNTSAPTGPSFQEISQGLDEQLEAYDKRFEEVQKERRAVEPKGGEPEIVE